MNYLILGINGEIGNPKDTSSLISHLISKKSAFSLGQIFTASDDE